MTTTYTHALTLNVRDADRAGLAKFIRHANHCGCDAVRCEGVIVHQTGGFDGPHLVPEYRVIRERDGAVMESLSLWDEADAERFAALAVACADGEPLGGTRFRLDPHPADTCRACL
jgi:hypothetical protein